MTLDIENLDEVITQGLKKDLAMVVEEIGYLKRLAAGGMPLSDEQHSELGRLYEWAKSIDSLLSFYHIKGKKYE
jgi:hypothetical protein